MAVTLAALQGAAAASPSANPNASYTYRILNNPSGGDAFMFRGALQQTAQRLSDRLYNTLASLLGGSAPVLNFVPTGSQFVQPSDTSANISDQVGAPQGTINVDPLAVEALINNKSPFHSSGVNTYPHEYAHLHQTAPTLADLMTREGGAQAFADLVTPTAAQRAGIPYDIASGNVDGDYAPYVQKVQQPPYGRDWIMGSQFGRTAPSVWP